MLTSVIISLTLMV